MLALFGLSAVCIGVGAYWTQIGLQQRSTDSVAISRSHAFNSDAGCKQGTDDRSSDLCAQWKAADAAESGAIAAWVFGSLGTLIGTLTLAAAAAAAWYAKRAAEHTEASVAADRPWMVLDVFKIDRFKGTVRDEGEKIEIKDGLLIQCGWANTGRSPALQCVTEAEVHTLAIDASGPDFADIILEKEGGAVAGSGKQLFALPRYVKDEDFSLWLQRKIRIFVIVEVFYKSIFDVDGRYRRSRFALEILNISHPGVTPPGLQYRVNYLRKWQIAE